ncbi:hypothetical protein Dsin_011358 [Dipteronia sinensis]|uniref:Endonuclease/exonuclease/phosphatase domain-containing protein n=1 Tax=Dipteronia sinensis TaxID=43782 RepID=A0AAE0EDG0_9ROSI|nr:hypothetical protein Dsin_011358 [Dipteronia sinensis]
MCTRRSSNHSACTEKGGAEWELEAEFVKVIEELVSRGVNLEEANQFYGEDGGWCVEEEVAKVLEIGAALGIKFIGNNDNLCKEIAIRDKEDMNVRGLGRSEKRRVVSKLVTKIKPFFLLLQESKVRSADYRLVKLLGGGILTKGMIIDAVGSSGGLISLWNEVAFSVKACVNTDKCSIILGELAILKKEVVTCNVYAPNVDMERVELWDFMVTNLRRFLVPWIVGGDFNVVLDASEKLGGPHIWSHLRNFRNFIDAVMLVNIPMQGFPLTWSNAREVASWARLDRFLVSPEILCWFPDLAKRNLPKSISDHSAVWMGIPKDEWGPYPFRFFDSWIENAEVMEQARNS